MTNSPSIDRPATSCISRCAVAWVLLVTLHAGCGDDGPAGPECPPPAAVIHPPPATEMETSRCGVAGDWLDSERLGEVVSTGEDPAKEQTAEFIEAAATLVGADLPRAPVHDVMVDTIVYTTQDRGQLVEASAVIAYPVRAEQEAPFPSLLFLHGTSGFTDGCGVSADAGSELLVAYVASLGYAVAAPDYIGLKAFGEPTGFLHPYLVGEATAIASLDAVRAMRRYVAENAPDVCTTDDLVFLGGSQGGHAALWVDRLAPYYAAEIDLLGGVATVPPADVFAQVQRALKESVPATANTVAFYGTSVDWYGLRDRIDEVFAPRDPNVPDTLASACDPSADLDDESLDSMFSAEILAAAASDTLASYDVWGCVATEASVNRSAISRITPTDSSYGILYVVGEQDTLVYPPIQRESFDALCEAGMPLDYLECEGASHGDATFWSLSEIIDYLAARVAREPVTDLCRRGAAVRCSATP